MTLTRLSGAKGLRNPLVSQLPSEWVAKGRWYEATQVAQLPLIRNKEIEAMERYASVLFPAPEWIGRLMDLIVPNSGFQLVSEFMTRGGGHRHDRTGPGIPPTHLFARPLHGHRERVGKAPWAVATRVHAEPPSSAYFLPLPLGLWFGRVCPLLFAGFSHMFVRNWARYIQSRPSFVDTIDWKRPPTFLLREDEYPCPSGSWL